MLHLGPPLLSPTDDLRYECIKRIISEMEQGMADPGHCGDRLPFVIRLEPEHERHPWS